MGRFHISKNGDPGKCDAQEGNCPLNKDGGQEAVHYPSLEEARAGEEARLSSQFSVVDSATKPEVFGYSKDGSDKRMSWPKYTEVGLQEALNKAEKLRKEGLFVTIEELHSEEKPGFEDDFPEEDDYEDEQEYEEAVEEWEESFDDHIRNDDLIFKVDVEYKAVGYQSRGAYERLLKERDTYMSGSSNSVNSLNPTRDKNLWELSWDNNSGDNGQASYRGWVTVYSNNGQIDDGSKVSRDV